MKENVKRVLCKEIEEQSREILLLNSDIARQNKNLREDQLKFDKLSSSIAELAEHLAR